MRVERPIRSHSHSAQWEFYRVISGEGQVRHQDGVSAICAGDAFLFKPGEPHQLINPGASELVFDVIADHPIGETGCFPDSQKWLVRSPTRAIIRSAPLEDNDGEE